MRKKHFLHENEKKTLANLFTKADLPPHAEVEVTVKWVGKNGQTKYAHIPILSEEDERRAHDPKMESLRKSFVKKRPYSRRYVRKNIDKIIDQMTGVADYPYSTDEIMRLTRG